jgi:hypothetical protein
MKKSKMILLMLAIIISVAGNAKAQDGSEYVLWEKTKDFTTIDVAISPDETQIAVSAEYTDTYPHTYSIKILSILSGEELYSIPIPNPGYPIFYTTDGKYLVDQGNGETNIIFDAKTYKKVKELPSGGITFSADNNFLSLAVTGYKFEILNSETFEIVYEKNLTKPADGEKGFYEVFFTPNSKYLVTNVTTYFENHYSERKIFQEIFDAKTFQKIDKTINCLKNYGTFSNNGLCANTFPKDEKVSTQPIGFRIYDYDKDSLLWEQETSSTGMLRFLSTKNYLFSCYQPGFGWNLDFWDLDKKALKKEYDGYKNKLYFDYGSKISKNDSYLVHGGGEFAPIRVYNFRKFLDEAVGVSTPNKKGGITIYPNPSKNSLTIDLNNDYTSKIEIKLIDCNGKTVTDIYSGIPSSNFMEFNTSNLPKGIYFIQLESERDSMTKKIIIE